MLYLTALFSHCTGLVTPPQAWRPRHFRQTIRVKAHEDGVSPLYLASFEGKADVVQTLLEWGQAVDDTCGDELRTPLWIAANNGHAECVAEFLGAGASADKPDKHGWTSLFAAAEEGYEEIVAVFIAAGASVDAQESDGDTPLALALANDHTAVADLLRGAGAA